MTYTAFFARWTAEEVFFRHELEVSEDLPFSRFGTELTLYPKTGSRDDKRLLVWHSGIDDPVTSGHYTLKVYASEKEETSEGSWHHTKILLKPVNPGFEPIVLTPEDEEDVRVIAELHTVLSPMSETV
jgi:hypothetical protein